MDFTRAQQADFHPSICCVNNHGKRGCWNNSNILFKTFPSCYNANLMTLPITPRIAARWSLGVLTLFKSIHIPRSSGLQKIFFCIARISIVIWLFCRPLHMIPIAYCISRLTTVIAAQQPKPSAMGFPPFFTSLTMSVFSPMAVMAMTMKNLLSVLSGANTDALTPRVVQIVVIRLATMNHKINIGNARLKLKAFDAAFSRFARASASTSVIGMIASVRVSFTVTALSSVCDPRP